MGGPSVGGGASVGATAVSVALTLFSISWGSGVGAGSLVGLAQAANTMLISKIKYGSVFFISLSPHYICR